MNFDFIAGFVGGGLAAFLVPVVMRWWDSWMSDEAWRNTGDDAPVNSQASVEARALHQAASAYLRAISGAR